MMLFQSSLKDEQFSAKLLFSPVERLFSPSEYLQFVTHLKLVLVFLG